MGGSDDLLAALLDGLRPGRGARRAGSGASSTCATAASTRRASASAASGSGTPTSSTCSRRARWREVKQLLDDNGLAHLELEFLWEWFLDPDDERRRASDETRGLLFDAAAALDAHHIKVGNIPGTPCELPRLTERYARALRRRGASSTTRGWSTSSCRST